MSTTTMPQDQIPPYQQPVDEVLTTLDTDARRGLSDGEARARLDRYGKNTLATEKPLPAWRKFLAQFQDVLVILLLIATGISAGLWLYERESALPYEALAIFAVVLLNAVMGYMQESRAEQAVAALRQMSAAHANVIRAGVRQSIPATEVVPGDILLIEEGRHRACRRTTDSVHRAPNGRGGADGREPAGVKGHASNYGRGRTWRPPQHALQRHGGDLRTRARGGRGDGNADRDGAHRRDAARSADETTPLQKELDRVGKLLGTHRRRDRRRDDRDDHPRRRRAAVSRRIFDVLILGVALAVAAVPEGLPAVVTAVLSPRRAADGEAERHRAPSRRRRNARLGERHRLRQDRHAHEERDDGAGRSSPRAGA